MRLNCSHTERSEALRELNDTAKAQLKAAQAELHASTQEHSGTKARLSQVRRSCMQIFFINSDHFELSSVQALSDLQHEIVAVRLAFLVLHSPFSHLTLV